MRKRKCVNPDCTREFEPTHKGHIWCCDPCYAAVLRREIGADAAGMRPLGLFGDREKIHAFNLKWAKRDRG